MSNQVNIKINLQEAGATQSLGKLSGEVKKFEGTVSGSFQKAVSAFSVFTGALAANVAMDALRKLSNVIKSSGQEFVTFQKQLAEVNTMLPKTDQLTEGMTENFIELSKQFGIKATEQVKTFYQILNDGITDSAKAMEYLEASNKLAVAGSIDQTTAAAGLVKVMQSYAATGIDAARVSELLIQASRGEQLAEFAGVIGNIAPTAVAANIGLDELTTSMVFLKDRMGSTEQATMSLRGIIEGLQAPTKTQTDLAKSLGIEIGSQALETKGLAGIMADISRVSQGNIETITRLTGSQRAARAAIIMTTTANEDYQKAIINTKNTNDTLERAFSSATETMDFQMKQLNSRVQAFGLQMLVSFEKPIVEGIKAVSFIIDQVLSFAGYLGQLSSKFTENRQVIIDYGKALIISTGLISGIVLALKANVVALSLATLATQGLAIAKGILTKAIVIFNAIFRLTPWGLAIAGITALTIGIGYLIRNFKSTGKIITDITNFISNQFFSSIMKVISIAEKAAGVFGLKIPSAMASLKDSLNDAKNKISENTSELEKNAEVTERTSDLKLNIIQNEIKEISELKKEEVLISENAQQEINNINAKAAEQDFETLKTVAQDKIKVSKKHYETEALLKQGFVQYEKSLNELSILDQKLKDDTNYQILVQNIGREQAVKEIGRARELSDQGKHQEAMGVLRDARASAQANNEKKMSEITSFGIERRLMLEMAGGRALLEFDKVMNESRVQALGGTLSRLAGMQRSQYSVLAGIGKAAAVAQITVDSARGAMSAYASLAGIPLVGPFLGAAAAGAIIAYGVEQIGRVFSAKQNFQQGGIVQGSSYTGDKVLANVNSGEMILNKGQQSNLFNMIQGGGDQSQILDAIRELKSAILSQPIIITIDRNEIGKAVRGAAHSGFSMGLT